ncbi:DUF305 domain-containing protein [Paenarthrobacter ureafaciens]|uniref:DUF305 domain-containing protein n=1 Tax=Paenarthrobacter ureafaciens TaxID=37931 RepID=UPI0022642084|nr:DUF305 domain-containing protein [Paenarthrobacter ureafaciens]MCX8454838.1 DUF305 domain-containing protein [Paenarthrobacter ureafaciens]MCY0975581.1 DUF305 domain-containing protein [Paenarthrobacter ureafaciens]
MDAAAGTPENNRTRTGGHDQSGPVRPTPAGGQAQEKNHPGGAARVYMKFGLILLVSLGLMWVLSMSMIRSIDHFYFNLSNFWMALVMVAAMAIVMIIGMWSMFKNTRANIAMLVGFAVLFGGAFALGRTETFVGNEQFLKSMIPHHSRALLVCQESDITDPEIIELCKGIVESQQREIDQMQAILDRYGSD